MSIIFVKDLPQKVTEEELRKHFTKFGQITYIKLKYKKDGKFRRIAFIGFLSDDIATKSKEYFNNTYFKQNKINVELCQEGNFKASNLEERRKALDLEDQEIKKEFKKFLKQEDITNEKLKEYLKNPKFIEYLEVHTKKTSKLVDYLKEKYGDTVKATNVKEKNVDEGIGDDEEDEKSEDKLANKQISDLEYLKSLIGSKEEPEKDEKPNPAKKTLFYVKVRTGERNTSKDKKGKTLTKKGVKDFFKPLPCATVRIPPHNTYFAYVGFRTEEAANKAVVKDSSFINGVRVRVYRYTQNESTDGKETTGENRFKEIEEKLLRTAPPVGESGKLFVRNLWYSVTEEDVRELFGKIGQLADVTVPVSSLTRKPKGFAHVTYIFPEDAVKAMNELDGMAFKGRILHILPALCSENDSETKSFKGKKKEEQKKSASSWHNWNSLFLSADAVADLMRDRFNQSKRKMFEDSGTDSAAVNLAIGETQIVDETKRFLEEEGISLEAFSSPDVQRSSTVILSKNLPAKTTAVELREVFGKYGELGRVIVPPSGVTGVIEFVDPSEAKLAFNKLAYTRFKHLPLYLEWAPIQVFKSPAASKQKSKVVDDRPLKEDENEDKNSNISAEPDATVYVKNLNFQTDEEALKKHFSQVGEVLSVLIAKKRALSQGYGFVQYARTADAKKALRELQNSSLDDHQLLIKLSEKILVSSGKSGRKFHSPGEQTSAKILVKNIPFQATREEVLQMFRAFGEIKLVRLPKKPRSEEHRGFGFVEFLTREDAEKALKAVGSSTHLYGRRLVIEWAKEDESVEELRKRTADRFLASGDSKKKRKVELEQEAEKE